jgi:hypothetical protein
MIRVTYHFEFFMMGGLQEFASNSVWHHYKNKVIASKGLSPRKITQKAYYGLNILMILIPKIQPV